LVDFVNYKFEDTFYATGYGNVDTIYPFGNAKDGCCRDRKIKYQSY
jgi:hypothetical protein